MKKIPFKYTPITIVLIILVIAVFGASAVFNAIDIFSFINQSVTRTVFSSVLTAFSVILLFVALSVVIYGRYIIKDGYLFIRFGIFYSKINIADIFQVTEFVKQKKLVYYIKGEKYSVAVIDKKRYQEFYDALKTFNPDITYTVISAEN